MDTTFKKKCFREIETDISKRYVLIFNIWADSKVTKTISQFDNFEDVKEEYMLLDEIYDPTPRPIKKAFEKYFVGNKKNPKYVFNEGGKFWGYIVIDYEKNEIIRIHKDGIQGFGNKITLAMKDYYLRGIDEIPEDFKFSCQSEYDGWLQYRWGNRMNAVDYVEPKKDLTPKESHKLEIYDGCEEDYELDEDYEFEAIETTFDDLLDKETKSRLMDKFGW